MTLINDVLDMSKIDEGKMSISHEAFDLSALRNPLPPSSIHRHWKKAFLFPCP